jgi:hypothetical protein
MPRQFSNDTELPEGATTEQVLAWIDQRKALLDAMRSSVLMFAGLGQRQPQRAPVTAPRLAAPTQNRVVSSAPRTSNKMKSGKTRQLIRQILNSGPLTPSEIFVRMQKKNWDTVSTNPRGLLGVTLRTMEKAGQVQKVGADYELVRTGRPGESSEMDDLTALAAENDAQQQLTGAAAE